MKRILTILLTALAMNLSIVANGAFAQNRFDTSAGDSSDSKTGDLEQWETVVDYGPFFDGVAQDLFGQSMAGFTLEHYDGHLGEYPGIALTRVDEERALEGYPYSLVVDAHIEADFNDEVDIYYVVGSLVTGHASFHGELAISVVSVAAEQGFYVFPLKPLTNAANGRTGDEVGSGHHSGGEHAQFSSDRAVGEASEISPEPIDEEAGECDDCVSDHNEAAKKYKKRYKRCRRKALFWGGLGTVAGTVGGGPWGCAAGLTGTAAALDACNDNFRDAKADTEAAYCDCWEDNRCDVNDGNYRRTCFATP